MYLPDFLDGFDRSSPSTRRRRASVHPTPSSFASSLSPGEPLVSSSKSVSSKCCVKARAGARARRGPPGLTRMGRSTPRPSRSTGFGPPISRTAPRFPTILPKLKDFVGESPIVAHAFKNERDFLNYEFARAKAIEWGESGYPEERYICTQVLFAQLFPGSSKSLTSMRDRLGLDSSERGARHGALLDADMTADALVLLERLLKHGESGVPRSWTST
jgi:DNA polymerase III subunit epsilon